MRQPLTPLPLALALCLWASTAAAATPKFGAFVSVLSGGMEGGEGHSSAARSHASAYTRATGSAALADGALHSFASALRPPCERCSRTGAQGTVAYWDTVTFHNGINISLLANTGLRIDGVLDGAFAQAGYRWYFGSPKTDFFERLNDYAPGHALRNGDTLVDDGLIVPIGGTRTYFVYAELSTYAQGTTLGDSVADFGNTLRFQWTLPEGLSVRSASGVFMSATPVPEPSSWALMLAGLAGTATIAGRRRNATR